MISTQPYNSIKRKPVLVKQLVVGDIILHGHAQSGAFHKITKMYGIKVCRRSTRIVFETKFYAIIRKGVVIFDHNDEYDPTFTKNPYPETSIQIINNLPVKL